MSHDELHSRVSNLRSAYNLRSNILRQIGTEPRFAELRRRSRRHLAVIRLDLALAESLLEAPESIDRKASAA